MTGQPLVSIVTPTLNRASFLEKAIRSVRSQHYPRVEHLVIDGGSTDSTLEIIRRYEPTYDLSWRSEPDEGMYQAINKGIGLTRGDIVAYLNSDDLYFPWTVKTVVRIMERDPEIDFVFGDMVSLDEQRQLGSVSFYPPFKAGFIKRFGTLGQPTVFLRRRIFDQFGSFDESLQYVADCDYWMRIGDETRGRKVNEILAIQINHPDAIRLARTQQVNSELQAVRLRHLGPGPRNLGIQTFFDRVYWFLVVRYYHIRFAVTVLRSKGSASSNNRAPWNQFISGDEDSPYEFRVNPWRLAARLTPLIGHRFSSGILKAHPKHPDPK